MKALYWSGNNKVLKSGYTVLQTWKGLSKTWAGYKNRKEKRRKRKSEILCFGNSKITKRTSRGRNCKSTISQFPDIDFDGE